MYRFISFSSFAFFFSPHPLLLFTHVCTPMLTQSVKKHQWKIPDDLAYTLMFTIIYHSDLHFCATVLLQGKISYSTKPIGQVF
jgi:hypothetical protein